MGSILWRTVHVDVFNSTFNRLSVEIETSLYSAYTILEFFFSFVGQFVTVCIYVHVAAIVVVVERYLFLLIRVHTTISSFLLFCYNCSHFLITFLLVLAPKVSFLWEQSKIETTAVISCNI